MLLPIMDEFSAIAAIFLVSNVQSSYTLRFGMNCVNFTNPADRKEKDSGKWFSKFIARHAISVVMNGI
ncbi:hypothetical protein Bca52824_011179 [Brassica carinata]|uniref:Uncharacterized protein n=1 Tax=Brassica carinata TaxID=52824 RepID=A0A8X7WFB2_BRACI|nr:hypothetical protein Bca52824_011179 [Brassica carinata]